MAHHQLKFVSVGELSPIIKSINVDLPDPESPTKATNEPLHNSRFICLMLIDFCYKKM